MSADRCDCDAQYTGALLVHQLSCATNSMTHPPALQVAAPTVSADELDLLIRDARSCDTFRNPGMAGMLLGRVSDRCEQLAATLATAEWEREKLRADCRDAARLNMRLIEELDKAVAVVTELVACKTLKGQWERSMSRDGDEMSATIALKEEYKRRQYLAWDAARSLVHPQEQK